MKLKIALLTTLIALSVTLVGCSLSELGGRPNKPQDLNTADEAEEACRVLCRESVDSGKELDRGPCLSHNNPDWKVNGWVCDIAHSPRKDIDNLAENQCPEYKRTVSRFIELTPICTMIKIHGD